MTDDAQVEQQVIEATDGGGIEEVLETPSVLDTPEIKQPAAKPQAHRGRIEAVTLTDPNEKGNRSIKFTLTSIDTGREDELDVWLPQDFVADIGIDPETLSTGEKDPTTGETIEPNQRASYGMGIANSDKTATLQSLRIFAAQANRVLPPDSKNPTNIEEYVELHGELLTGLESVYILTPNKKAEDPRFRNFLRVSRFMSVEDTVGNPKVLRKYLKAWDGELS